MSDKIMGDRAAFNRDAAWHLKGHVVPNGMTIKEASELVRLSDIQVELRPTFVDLGGVMEKAGQNAIVRLPTPDDDRYRVFGYCKDSYTVLQHTDLVDKAEKLTEKWPVETIGILGKGETLFLTLDAGEREVKGDPIHQYFLLADTKDGQTGISLHFTPVRVVCQNTLMLGKAAAVSSARMRHSSNLSQELDWHIQMIGELQSVADKIIHQFELMADAALSEEGMGRILRAAYPTPRKPKKVELAESISAEEFFAMTGMMFGLKESQSAWESTRERMEERRAGAMLLYNKFNDEQPNLARTPWAGYNAIVELEDYRKSERKEDVEFSAVFGMRALTKERAFVQSMEETLR